MKQLSLKLALLFMTGCSWLGGDADADAELEEMAKLQDFNEEVELDEIWSASFGSGQEKSISSLRPALNSGKVYVADDEGLVVAVDQNTGDKVWSVELDVHLSGGVGYGGNMIFVGSHDGILYALREDDGTLLWQAQLSSEILSPADSDGDFVAVQTLDGKLFALNTETGEQIWVYETEMPVLTLYGTSAPLIAKGRVGAGFANGKIVVLEGDSGAPVWEGRLTLPRGQTELDRLSDIDGQLLLVGEVLYVSGYHGSVAAISRTTGRTLWSKDSSSHHGVSIAGSRLFVVDMDDNVVSMRSSGGQQLWVNNEFRNRGLIQPLGIGAYVVAADKDGYLHVLSANDGHVVGRTHVDGSGVHVPIATDGETLYVLDADGGLTAYRINKN